MRTLFLVAALAACGSYPTSTPAQPGTLTLTVTSPAPGAELGGSGGGSAIAVTGTLATTSADYGTLGVWVDGSPAQLDDSGSFTASVPADIGIDHVLVEASDGGGDSATQQFDVLVAADYLAPAAGTTNFTVPDALALDLGQQFFDGQLLGTTLDRTTDPVVAHDLAASLELILWDADLASLLGGGLHVGSGSSALDIQITSVTPSGITVDAAIADGSGVDLDIELDGVELATTGSFTLAGQTLPVQGSLSADMHATVHLNLGVGSDGSIAVTVSDASATVGPLVPSFTGSDGAELDGFIQVGNNDFRTLVTSLIQLQLIPAFTNDLPPLLESLLGATGQLLDGVTFSLDAQLGSAVDVTLGGDVGQLEVAAGPAIGATPGHVTVHQDITIATASTPMHADSRGAARVASPAVAPPTDDASLHVRIADDFFNSLLHALWNGGLLDGSTMEGGLNVTVAAKLQPFVRPVPDEVACTVDGARCDLVLELGELELSLPDLMQSFTIHATAGARIEVSGTTISIVVEQVPDVIVWDTSTVPGGPLTPDAVKSIVTETVWPQLFGAIGDKLHVTLPIPDLASLGIDSLGPALANAQLTLAVHPQSAVTQGFVGLGADLELATPAP
jgi:hypothetical protein|nr:hypothetical protein [Kofleriaceae bacterium]